jgi:hypothetical protein
MLAHSDAWDFYFKRAERTAQKKAKARLRDIISDLSQRIGSILPRVNKSLHPDSLPQMDRAERQECFVALEQMKMLMSELEIFRLGRK